MGKEREEIKGGNMFFNFKKIRTATNKGKPPNCERFYFQ